jgi:hypothetical protein
MAKKSVQDTWLHQLFLYRTRVTIILLFRAIVMEKSGTLGMAKKWYAEQSALQQ